MNSKKVCSEEQKISQLENKIAEFGSASNVSSKAERIISKTARRVLNALKDREFENIAGFAY